MYRNLWSNSPKEGSLEYPDYTYEEHFGKELPSHIPRTLLRDYLEGGSSLDFFHLNFVPFFFLAHFVSCMLLTKRVFGIFY